jgi:hypothetical protein
MVAIPKNEITTVNKIYEAYEADEKARRNDLNNGRGHLGASQIGQECLRRLWYGWRWSSEGSFPGRMLRLFETGNREEARFVANLRRVGVEVEEVDPATGQQWTVRDSTGHFGGSLDGIGVGFIEAPKTVHVLEFKTHNDKSFTDLCKNRVQLSKPQHYAQMQVYMHLKGIQRAFYLAVNKNNDALYQERIYYKAAPARHCRSCVFSTPIEDGQWHCNKHQKTLSLVEQKIGCNFHRYLPELLVTAKSLDAGDDFAWVEYQLPDGSIWRDEGV